MRKTIIFIISILLFLLGTVAFVVGSGNKSTIEDREAILRWRIPAEREYRRVQDEFMERGKILKREFAEQPKELKNKISGLRQEEKRLLQHALDRHGFIEAGFWVSKPQPFDSQLEEKIVSQDPELYRVERRYSLKKEIQAHEYNHDFYQKLLNNRTEALQELQDRVQIVKSSPEFSDLLTGEEGGKYQEMIEEMTPKDIQETLVGITTSRKNLTKELAQLEHEEAQWQFPWPNQEEKTFSEFSIAFWDLKKIFLEQYGALSTASPSYPRDRWDLTQEYRITLRKLMRSNRIRPAHFDEYFERAPHFLQSYLQQQIQNGEQVKKIEASLKKSGHVLALDKAEGMGLIIGTVIQRADLTEKGSDRQQRIPIADIPIELVTQGETTIKHRGFFRRTSSNAQGQFVIPAVPPGNYYLSIMFRDREKFILYRAPNREFFVDSNQEVLILDMMVEKTGFTIGSAPQAEANP